MIPERIYVTDCLGLSVVTAGALVGLSHAVFLEAQHAGSCFRPRSSSTKASREHLVPKCGSAKCARIRWKLCAGTAMTRLLRCRPSWRESSKFARDGAPLEAPKWRVASSIATPGAQSRGIGECGCEPRRDLARYRADTTRNARAFGNGRPANSKRSSAPGVWL